VNSQLGPDSQPTAPGGWHKICARHLWKVRAYQQEVSGTKSWFWEAYTSQQRRIGLRSEPENLRWNTEEEALAAAAEYIKTWEHDRPQV
jgi:hypothetical protein